VSGKVNVGLRMKTKLTCVSRCYIRFSVVETPKSVGIWIRLSKLMHAPDRVIRSSRILSAGQEAKYSRIVFVVRSTFSNAIQKSQAANVGGGRWK